MIKKVDKSVYICDIKEELKLVELQDSILHDLNVLKTQLDDISQLMNEMIVSMETILSEDEEF